MKGIYYITIIALSAVIALHTAAAAQEAGKSEVANSSVKASAKVAKKHKTAKHHHNQYPMITEDNLVEGCGGAQDCFSKDELMGEHTKHGKRAYREESARRATEVVSADSAEGCPLTPEIWEVQARSADHRSNDLRRLSGSPYLAQGKMINIVGRVLDQNCVPVTGARIQMTQVDSLGRESDDPERDRGFTGSGITFTDNLGRYSFFSVMPGPNDNRAPHVRFSIDHPEIQHFETEMFFPDSLAAESDPMLRSQVAKEQRHLLISKYIGYNVNEGIDVYEFAITLNGSLNYKTY